jgi:hypothetical protein
MKQQIRHGGEDARLGNGGSWCAMCYGMSNGLRMYTNRYVPVHEKEKVSNKNKNNKSSAAGIPIRFAQVATCIIGHSLVQPSRLVESGVTKHDTTHTHHPNVGLTSAIS